jgi:SNF2 family DNA or RNA helicase
MFGENLFDARVIVGTYTTMAESYNLVRACRLVLFQPDWLIMNERQAKARVWRCGQTRSTHCYRLVTVDSVDQTMSERQEQGTKFNEAVLGVPLDINDPDAHRSTSRDDEDDENDIETSMAWYD